MHPRLPRCGHSLTAINARTTRVVRSSRLGCRNLVGVRLPAHRRDPPGRDDPRNPPRHSPADLARVAPLPPAVLDGRLPAPRAALVVQAPRAATALDLARVSAHRSVALRHRRPLHRRGVDADVDTRAGRLGALAAVLQLALAAPRRRRGGMVDVPAVVADGLRPRVTGCWLRAIHRSVASRTARSAGGKRPPCRAPASHVLIGSHPPAGRRPQAPIVGFRCESALTRSLRALP